MLMAFSVVDPTAGVEETTTTTEVKRLCFVMKDRERVSADINYHSCGRAG